MTAPLSTRIREVMRKLQNVQHTSDLVTGDARAVAEERMTIVEASANDFLAGLKPTTAPVPFLDGPALWQSIATAVVGAARAKGAARFTPADLKASAEDHAPARDLPFWAREGAGVIVGLLRRVPEVRKLIEAQGVLFWDQKEKEDDNWRLVDTGADPSHAEIYRRMTEPRGGYRCGYCGILENTQAPRELRPLDVKRDRGGTSTINGRVVIPAGAGMLVHEQCRPHLVKWLEIAAKYQSVEEAEAADAAARPKLGSEKP